MYSTGYCTDPNLTTTTSKPDATAATTPALDQYGCDFEDQTVNQGFCFWKQLTNDNFDWTRISKSTSSTQTGPSADHTTGGNTGDEPRLYADSP